VIWGRDREERFQDRLATNYYIEAETAPNVWQVVANSNDRAAVGQTPTEENTSPERKILLATQARLTEQLAQYGSSMPVYAGTFATPEPTFRLERGDPMRPAERLPAGAPKSISPPLDLSIDSAESERRISFARWLGDPQNPLPARVMVNRAWHYHFGRGLVPTPSDFGFQGGLPSHPALLEWLAHQYRGAGYRLKPIHKLIVTSSTYRQANTPQAKAEAIDRNNTLLWHRSPRRLEAESLRDAMLFTSSSLDFTMGGPGYNVWEKNTNYVVVFKPRSKLGPDTFRRMVYQFKPRSQHDSTFGAFDCPDASLVTPRRNSSITAIQALNLLNSDFVLEQSDRLADRIKKETGSNTKQQVERSFLLTLNRPPTDIERAAGVRLVAQHGLSSLTRALYNANEFVYVP
jgi:hypothetical protein